ncbi:Holliday junction branch migration protein RuvA [Aquibacillus rhizosphaerae]|uniref:Holliday junction branch migration complex subunit RuvA n=1 Tax=Aquibacillus rhizosphaerae TaxID=3051431 RepID=A0ABT7L8X5_9BACI|nr:Holliday junction branch migration protein RuvA [Aquibacillus sp. LR5S19]MDL4841640.1 Holliday junction branch migration protein RuvA [Aquibacillus sp. LR5S19]
MIAYINGILELVTESVVIVEANGVGYEIICANPFAFQDKIGENVRIYTYHYVREDTQVLYGFKNTDEKLLFSKILSVSGIGPKGALSILGVAGVQDFVVAIEEENEKFLTGFPGVGKKTARQMILDLKGKLPFEYTVTEHQVEEGKTTNTAAQIQALEEAFEALKSLGYSDREIKSIAPTLKQDKHANADEFVRKGLALMMQK